VTPDYINKHWTEELLMLMFNKRWERIKRMNAQMAEAYQGNNSGQGSKPARVPDHYLFRVMGQKVHQVKAKKKVVV
jgi:hypothetical protein